LLAIAFPVALWLSDFVPEHAGRAWDSIKHGASLLMEEVATYPGVEQAHRPQQTLQRPTSGIVAGATGAQGE
jgi:hypothetical protein